jgi:hypothetical protein
MTIEQRPELNRLIGPDSVAPWRSRWRRIKLLFPFWLFVFALVAQMTLLASWVEKRPLLSGFAFTFEFSLLPIALLFGLLEVLGWFGRRVEKVYEFSYDKIVFGSHENAAVVYWPFVLKFQFEPIETFPGMTRLTIARAKFLRAKQFVEQRSIVIEQRAQADELLAWLQNRKSGTPLKFEVVVLDKAPPLFDDPPYYLTSLILIFFGLYLFGNGAGCIEIGLFGNHAKLLKLFASYFSTAAELRIFFLTVGFILLLVGFAMMKYGKRLGNTKPTTSAPSCQFPEKRHCKSG